MSGIGAFTFVLHSHLPYARLAGRWPHGEEWIHEAAIDTYLPLLEILYDLKQRGFTYKLTIGLTPVLSEQLADPLICDHLDDYIDDRIARARQDVLRFRKRWQEIPTLDEQLHSSSSKLESLALWYQRHYEHIRYLFNSRFKRDIIGAFRQLQDEGHIEIITCAATHGYLPLFGTDAAIRAQLRTGIRSYERLFGRRPKGIWLPECAYRPAYFDEVGHVRPGIEHFLADEGLSFFFSETETITGQEVSIMGYSARQMLVVPGYTVPRSYLSPSTITLNPNIQLSTFNSYYVSDPASVSAGEPHRQVVVIGRNSQTSARVWSAQIGYPGHPVYREFHRKDEVSGLQYWRITGQEVDLGGKVLYHPARAAEKARQDAQDFVEMVTDTLYTQSKDSKSYGIIASNYDSELFGHWWFEGIEWLKHVLRDMARSPHIDLVTASEYITRHPPERALDLPEGSWGAGGSHSTWNNEQVDWIWRELHAAQERMTDFANRFHPHWDDLNVRAVLNQAARELLLAESSDWPFLITTGQATDYASQRFSQHLARFNQLCDSLEKGQPDIAAARQYWELDKLFQDIDYRWWCTKTD